MLLTTPGPSMRLSSAHTNGWVTEYVDDSGITDIVGWGRGTKDLDVGASAEGEVATIVLGEGSLGDDLLTNRCYLINYNNYKNQFYEKHLKLFY